MPDQKTSYMRRLVTLVLVIVLIGGLAGLVVASQSNTLVTAARFATLGKDATGMRDFLSRMPKGGDLHTHLSGAVYAERLIAWATQDGLCLRMADLTIVKPPCALPEAETETEPDPEAKAPKVRPLAEVAGDQGTFDRIVNALSLRWYNPSPAVPSGHDQFFATFGKIGASTDTRFVDMVIDQLDHYAADNVQYVEIMTTLIESDERRAMVAALGDLIDPAAMLDALESNGFDQVVSAMGQRIETAVTQINTRLACDGPEARPGCAVSYRFLGQIIRTMSLKSVFVQTAAAAAIVRADPNVVGFNFVAPEDYLVARHDYRDHMRFIDFLSGDDVAVSLHAGELWIGLVPPDDLTFHIRDAVETARARRIGHGVDLAYERDMNGLLVEMRQRNVAVEVNLTSNDAILGVRGDDHPLHTYLSAGVPVVLSTDDAGVSRIDMSHEYLRAAREQGLGYQTLKAIARTSLTHSFLSAEDKATELERFDSASTAFEQVEAGRLSLPERILTVARAVFLSRW